MLISILFVAALAVILAAILYGAKKFFPHEFAFWHAGARVKTFTDIYKKVSPQATDDKGRTFLFEAIRRKSFFRIKFFFTLWPKISHEAKLVVNMDVAGVPKTEIHRYHMLEYTILGGVKNFERGFSFLVDRTESIDDLMLARKLLMEMNRPGITDEELVESYQLCLSLVDHRMSQLRPQASATVTQMPHRSGM